MFKDKKARKAIELIHVLIGLEHDGKREIDWGLIASAVPVENPTLKERIIDVERKVDLILDHLNLEYVPEKEVIEEPKLVTKADEKLYKSELYKPGGYVPFSMLDLLIEKREKERILPKHGLKKDGTPKKKPGRKKSK